MLFKITGDIIKNAKLGCSIAHQVNYTGIMGGGVALYVKDDLIPAADYTYYQYLCHTRHSGMLGQNLVTLTPFGGYVFNMFSQTEYLQPDIGLTDYSALHQCLEDARAYLSFQQEMRGTEMPLYVPDHLGCGIAGGNWDEVSRILGRVFDGNGVNCYVVKRGMATPGGGGSVILPGPFEGEDE